MKKVLKKTVALTLIVSATPFFAVGFVSLYFCSLLAEIACSLMDGEDGKVLANKTE